MTQELIKPTRSSMTTLFETGEYTVPDATPALKKIDKIASPRLYTCRVCGASADKRLKLPMECLIDEQIIISS